MATLFTIGTGLAIAIIGFMTAILVYRSCRIAWRLLTISPQTLDSQDQRGTEFNLDWRAIVDDLLYGLGTASAEKVKIDAQGKHSKAMQPTVVSGYYYAVESQWLIKARAARSSAKNK